jgi:hypothetical protein
MQMRKRITQETIERLQDYLVHYIEEWSSINPNKKFRCFNSSYHKRNDADPSAAVVPDSRNKYWKCFSCEAKGDVFKAVMYREGIKSFYDQAVFLSKKYGVQLQYEGEENPVQAVPDEPKENVHKYFYQDEKGNTVYRIVRKEYFEGGIRKKDFSMHRKTDSGWVPGLKGVKRYLYKLPSKEPPSSRLLRPRGSFQLVEARSGSEARMEHSEAKKGKKKFKLRKESQENQNQKNLAVASEENFNS